MNTLKSLRFALALMVTLALLSVSLAAAQVNIVQPQAPRQDGSLVHIVRQGDTLYGIVNAYARYGVTTEILIAQNSWRFEPDFIYVDEAVNVLPPGTLDPNTGELLITDLESFVLNNDASSNNPVDESQPLTPDTNNPVDESQPLIPGVDTSVPPDPDSLTTLSASEIEGLLVIEAVEPFVPTP